MEFSLLSRLREQSFLRMQFLITDYGFLYLSLIYTILLPSVTNILQAPDFPGGSDGKASAYNAGDLGSILGLG